jgi:hypothetical protein
MDFFFLEIAEPTNKLTLMTCHQTYLHKKIRKGWKLCFSFVVTKNSFCKVPVSIIIIIIIMKLPARAARNIRSS